MKIRHMVRAILWEVLWFCHFWNRRKWKQVDNPDWCLIKKWEGLSCLICMWLDHETRYQQLQPRHRGRSNE